MEIHSLWILDFAYYVYACVFCSDAGSPVLKIGTKNYSPVPSGFHLY